MSYFDKEMRLKAFDAAMEIGRSQSTPEHVQLASVLYDARAITAFITGDELRDRIPETQADTNVTLTSPALASSNTEAFSEPLGDADEPDPHVKPTRKARGPNKPKAAKKASGKKRGRPARAEAAAEKDLPIANTNGTGEHAPAPITGDEPQPIAA